MRLLWKLSAILYGETLASNNILKSVGSHSYSLSVQRTLCDHQQDDGEEYFDSC